MAKKKKVIKVGYKGGQARVTNKKLGTRPRIQNARRTVSIPSDPVAPAKPVRKQPVKKRKKIPGRPSGNFGAAGPNFGMNTAGGAPKDHGPRLDQGNYPDPPIKKKKKVIRKPK